MDATSIIDIQKYAIKLKWNLELTNYSQLQVFEKNLKIPTNRIIENRLPFGVKLFYIVEETRSMFIGELNS